MSKSFKNNKYHTYNPYWQFWEHAPSWWNREARRKFRHNEKQYFKKFGETLTPTKDRGWGYW
ncbi:hypothetical protein M0R72_19785 [Candidatus Pacearchaeota archaeon]|jgi:hypothetical protein|nr:hypothetical protein [Candidatus Pacearchaeota archaeon]